MIKYYRKLWFSLDNEKTMSTNITSTTNQIGEHRIKKYLAKNNENTMRKEPKI